MPETSETLEILVRLRDRASRGLKGLDREMKKLPRSVRIADRAFDSLKRSLTSLRSSLQFMRRQVFSLQGLFVGFGGTLLARSFIQAASAAEQYKTRLTVLLGSVEEGNRLFEEMAKYAGTVSFEYEQVMGGATALAGVMKGGVDEIVQWMPMIGDLAAAAGMGIEETIGQTIRMYSAGAASADMFRERGILAMLGFQAGVSYTAEETRKRLIEAWEDPLSKFRGASLDLAKTWSGLFSMLSDLWFQFRNMVMDAGLFNFMKASVATLLEYFQDLREQGDLKEWAKIMSDAVVKYLEDIIWMAGGVAEAFRGWQVIWQTFMLAYAKSAPYLLSTLKYISQAIGGIAILAWSVAEALGSEGVAGKLKGVIDTMDSLNKMSEDSKKYWEGVVEGAGEALENLSKQEPYYDRIASILDAIKKKAEEYAETIKKATPEKEEEKVPTAKPEVLIKSELARSAELIKTQLAFLASYYQQGLIDYISYFKERERLLFEQYQNEKKALEKLLTLAPTEKPEKAQAIRDKIFALEQKHQRDLAALRNEAYKAEEVDEEKRAEMIKSHREAMYQDLKWKDDSYLQYRVEQLAEQYKEYKTYAENEAQAVRWLNEQKKLLLDEYLAETDAAYKALTEMSQRTADAIEQTFSDYFFDLMSNKFDTLKDHLTGLLDSLRRITADVLGQIAKEWLVGQAKKLFNMKEDVALTKVKIDQLFQEKLAVSSLAKEYNVLAASKIKAAAAGIAGGAGGWGPWIPVLSSRQQALGVAEGGEIPGKSPHPKADNILARLTAGEFVQPVDVVRHYGSQVMEALRQKAIPREVFRGFDVGSFRVPTTPRLSYATGGPVSDRGMGVNMDVNVINESGVSLKAEPGETRFDGSKYVTDIHLTKLMVSRSYRQAHRRL